MKPSTSRSSCCGGVLGGSCCRGGARRFWAPWGAPCQGHSFVDAGRSGWLLPRESCQVWCALALGEDAAGTGRASMQVSRGRCFFQRFAACEGTHARHRRVHSVGAAMPCVDSTALQDHGRCYFRQELQDWGSNACAAGGAPAFNAGQHNWSVETVVWPASVWPEPAVVVGRWLRAGRGLHAGPWRRHGVQEHGCSLAD